MPVQRFVRVCASVRDRSKTRSLFESFDTDMPRRAYPAKRQRQARVSDRRSLLPACSTLRKTGEPQKRLALRASSQRSTLVFAFRPQREAELKNVRGPRVPRELRVVTPSRSLAFRGPGPTPCTSSPAPVSLRAFGPTTSRPSTAGSRLAFLLLSRAAPRPTPTRSSTAGSATFSRSAASSGSATTT